jgi:hypothetical protein
MVKMKGRKKRNSETMKGQNRETKKEEGTFKRIKEG